MDVSGLVKRFSFLENGTCPQCGAALFSPKEHLHVKACMECGYTSVATKTKEERLRDIQMQNRKDEAFNYLMNTSCLGSTKVFNYNFGNYRPIDEKEAQVRNKALVLADKLASGIKNDPMHIFLQGGTGRGKTHIAVAMMYEALQQVKYGKPARKKIGEKYQIVQVPIAVTFVNWSRFMTLKQEAIRDEEKEKRFVLINTALQTADIAIVDDLGKEGNSDWYFQTFDELMEIREDQHIIITTNLEGEDLVKRYGDRSLSRLRKHARGNFISFAGIKDHRMLKEGK